MEPRRRTASFSSNASAAAVPNVTSTEMPALVVNQQVTRLPKTVPDAGRGQVPEVAHVVWLTGASGKDDRGNPMSNAQSCNIADFARLNPNWEITCWTDDQRIAPRLPSNVELRHWTEALDSMPDSDEALVRDYVELTRSRLPASGSDMIRILALKKGGLYWDVDTKWNAPIPHSFRIEGDLCLHKGVENALIAMPPGSPWPRKIIQSAAKVLRESFEIEAHPDGSKTWRRKGVGSEPVQRLVDALSIHILQDIPIRAAGGIGHKLRNFLDYECPASNHEWRDNTFTGGTIGTPTLVEASQDDLSEDDVDS
jgi:hypothetical protein